MNKIEDLMKQVEKRRDPYFYSHISNYEVKYGPETEEWELRKILESGKYGGTWSSFTKETYIERFTELNINMFSLQEELHRSCLTEAIYHSMLYKDLKKFLGEEEVLAAEEEFRLFGEALAGTIDKLVRRKNIKLV